MAWRKIDRLDDMERVFLVGFHIDQSPDLPSRDIFSLNTNSSPSLLALLS